MHNAAKVIISVVVLGLGLSGCCNGADCEVTPTPATSRISIPPFSPPPSDPPPAKATYQVPRTDCPGNYGVPLVVTTDTEAEVEYIDKITACTTVSGATTYLENNSDAVWVLRNTGSVDGDVTPWGDTLTMTSYRGIFAAGRNFLVPGGVVTVDLPPASLAWDLELPLTVGWVGHSVVAGKIASLGQQALADALKRTGRLSPALVQCTLAVTKYAGTVDGLADKQLSTIVMEGLGVGIATSKCRDETLKVTVREPTTKLPIALSDDIAKASRVTEYLEGIDKFLNYAKQGSRFSKLAIRFVAHL
ncbi:hypothetical protein F1D05_14670 [Kribbella qitaiheensis]|uniref:Uncharacterized protein n=1 Tax=Kribbella qitaiheensis TaxID=1544730 RepID=A0A7G6WY62_9ACTN|nr:hypothetical protein [Kribbella qitaiheensis]QNE18927.1 hypothetical protein F1D05_14670 [Kribbella qitaiheensis]